MARGKTSPEGSSYSYFKQLFTEHPELLDEKKNAEILAYYRAAHQLDPSAPIAKTVMNNMSNLKSNMRKKNRKNKSAKAVASGTPLVRSTNKLERLEERIDDCLTMARVLDAAGLEEVIHLLRRARNKVVWKLGEM